MKVIWRDGYGREHIDEREICTGLTPLQAKVVAAALNAVGEESDYYFVADDDDEPYRFTP